VSVARRVAAGTDSSFVDDTLGRSAQSAHRGASVGEDRDVERGGGLGARQAGCGVGGGRESGGACRGGGWGLGVRTRCVAVGCDADDAGDVVHLLLQQRDGLTETEAVPAALHETLLCLALVLFAGHGLELAVQRGGGVQEGAENVGHALEQVQVNRRCKGRV